MRGKSIKVSVCKSEGVSWNAVWEWWWFLRDTWSEKAWCDNREALNPLVPLLLKWKVRSILDSSCGLGFKTVLFSKKGYDVEGSDASGTAIKYAPKLAKEEGIKIRFFRSRYSELGKKCTRKYDCVWSDNFDELKTRYLLRSSAKGIYSVLKKGGRFIFSGTPPEWTKDDLANVIEKEWKKREKYHVNPPYERDGVRVINIEVAEKIQDGILENQMFLVEQDGKMRVEIGSIMNPRIKWTFQDYIDVLKGAGFREVKCIKREGQIFNIAIK
jgi:SAM-dependent methyltransferase